MKTTRARLLASAFIPAALVAAIGSAAAAPGAAPADRPFMLAQAELSAEELLLRRQREQEEEQREAEEGAPADEAPASEPAPEETTEPEPEPSVETPPETPAEPELRLQVEPEADVDVQVEPEADVQVEPETSEPVPAPEVAPDVDVEPITDPEPVEPEAATEPPPAPAPEVAPDVDVREAPADQPETMTETPPAAEDQEEPVTSEQAPIEDAPADEMPPETTIEQEESPAAGDDQAPLSREERRRLLRERMNATEEPTVDEPTAEEPSGEQPAAEQPSTEEPTAEQPAPDAPADAEEAAPDAAADQPAAETPAPDEPAAPATAEPAAEAPAEDETPTAPGPVAVPLTQEEQSDRDQALGFTPEDEERFRELRRLRDERRAAADARERYEDEADRLSEIREERRELRRDGRTYYEEPDGRIILNFGGQTIIRSSELERLREGASDVEVVRDGEYTRTIVIRPDGTRVITVTDEEGNVIRRIRRTPEGRDYVLFDNEPFYDDGGWWRDRSDRRRDGRDQPQDGGFGFFVDIAPPVIDIPRERYIVEAERAAPQLIYETFAAPPVIEVEETYSLDQVVNTPALLERVRRVDLDTITFQTGAWRVEEGQIDRLDTIADAILRVLEDNPNEVFLIEGHTDAVGSQIDNLSLSDRRAEEVAYLLTEYYGVPAENLTTKGYGESNLKVRTEGPSRENRRVTMRRITPLLQTSQAR